MFPQIVERLSIAIVLLMAVGANASPTVSSQAVVLTPNVCPAYNPTQTLYLTGNVVEVADAQLITLGREFLRSPASSIGLGSTAINIKPLPAIPATILMVLSGFLCVSLVRDRKVWLAVLIGLLWVGQTGIQALPQLVLRLGHRNHIEQRPCAAPAHPYSIENLWRLRSYIEDTRYICLLHHLAGIPDSTMSFLQQKQESTSCKLQPTNKTSQFAITRLISQSIPAADCLAPKVEQCVCFSPAFIFANFPRGPPIPA